MDSKTIIETARSLIDQARALGSETLTVPMPSRADAEVMRSVVVGESGGGGAWSDLEAESDDWGIRFVVDADLGVTPVLPRPRTSAEIG